MLRELFTDPDLAADKRYADVLREYLGADIIGPLPIRRMAAAYPEAVGSPGTTGGSPARASR
jgi:hypothetical protein